MGDGQPAYPYVAVGRQQSQLLADMDTIIRGEFKTKFNGILIREIIRTTAKTVVQKQLNDSSPWLGLIAAVAQAATTQADLRGWMTLRSEEHTSELQSLMRTSYAVFCLKKKTTSKHLIQLEHTIQTRS